MVLIFSVVDLLTLSFTEKDIGTLICEYLVLYFWLNESFFTVARDMLWQNSYVVTQTDSE